MLKSWWSGIKPKARALSLLISMGLSIETLTSMALCLLNSARSNRPVQYERFKKSAENLGTKKQKEGAKLKVCRIPVLSSLKVIFFPSCGRMPWFAIAFSIGQADLESPSWGDTYSGHVRLWPGAWAGMTLPGLSAGMKILRIKSPRSQIITNILMKAPAILCRIPPMLLSAQFVRLNFGAWWRARDENDMKSGMQHLLYR